MKIVRSDFLSTEKKNFQLPADCLFTLVNSVNVVLGISRFCVNLLETLEDKDTEDSELPIPQNIVENMTAKQEKWNNTTKCITKIMHKKEKTRIKAYVVFHN